MKPFQLIFLFVCIIPCVLFAQSSDRWLGVKIQKHQKGLEIIEVVKNSPVINVWDEERETYFSLGPKDVILSIMGERTNDPQYFVNVIKSGPPVITMWVWDNSASITRYTLAAISNDKDEVNEYIAEMEYHSQQRAQEYYNKRMYRYYPDERNYNNDMYGESPKSRNYNSYGNNSNNKTNDNSWRISMCYTAWRSCNTACRMRPNDIPGDYTRCVKECERERDQCLGR